ncbi:phage tail protein [Waterburya agarophytonicola]|nr:phage tail protein [Waterburya agarophytonicola]
MTNPNENNSDRLDRIEQLFEQNEIRLGRMILQQESDNRRMLAIERTIQAMLEQRATDKLEHDERMRFSEERINRLEDVAVKLANIEEAQNKMLVSIDEDRPTVLRRLMAIENKVDSLIERDRRA